MGALQLQKGFREVDSEGEGLLSLRIPERKFSKGWQVINCVKEGEQLDTMRTDSSLRNFATKGRKKWGDRWQEKWGKIFSFKVEVTICVQADGMIQ